VSREKSQQEKQDWERKDLKEKKMLEWQTEQRTVSGRGMLRA
jgi:hypothetical protein